jgi:hypothetical protein
VQPTAELVLTEPCASLLPRNNINSPFYLWHGTWHMYQASHSVQLWDMTHHSKPTLHEEHQGCTCKKKEGVQ